MCQELEDREEPALRFCRTFQVGKEANTKVPGKNKLGILENTREYQSDWGMAEKGETRQVEFRSYRLDKLKGVWILFFKK